MRLGDFLRRMRRGRPGGERPLFRTHTPAFQVPEWEVGELVEWEGRVFLVTRWLELPAVPLNRGGSVQEWEVWGRPVEADSLEAEVAGAAERILREATGERPRQGSFGESSPPGTSGGRP
ncbi:MAG: hypothetical protein Kow00122_15880 [Thermoleophilia bacterium]